MKIATMSVGMCLLISVFAPQSWADMVPGLVAHYELDGNAIDSSGGSRNGTIFGATAGTDRFGNPSGAMQFDGNDYIVASADGLPTAERTVALWFWAAQVANRPVMLGYGGGSCGTSWFEGLNHAGSAAYYTGVHCGRKDFAAGYGVPPIEQWIHWAITTSSLGTVYYVNGLEFASNSTFINDTFTAGKDLSFGVATSPAGTAPYTDINIGFFQGLLDDVRIYDRALSSAEINALAALPTPPSPVPEPSTLALLLVGLAGLGASVRRSRWRCPGSTRQGATKEHGTRLGDGSGANRAWGQGYPLCELRAG